MHRSCVGTINLMCLNCINTKRKYIIFYNFTAPLSTTNAAKLATECGILDIQRFLVFKAHAPKPVLCGIWLCLALPDTHDTHTSAPS